VKRRAHVTDDRAVTSDRTSTNCKYFQGFEADVHQPAMSLRLGPDSVKAGDGAA
jgi:hypothetical protein